MITEFIGLPGSGKSTVLYLLNDKDLFNKNFTYKNFLFNNFYKKNYLNYINKFLILLLRKYKNIIFLKNREYNYTINIKLLFIKISIFFFVRSLSKKNFLLYKYYKNLLSLSSHSIIRKVRMEINFLLSFMGFYLYKKNKFTDSQIIDDEGFYQKIIMRYSNFSYNKKKIFYNIKKYLDLCPKPDKVLIFYLLNKNIISRIKKRKQGYSYIKEDIDNNLLYWNKVIDYVILFIKKKINVIIINNNGNKKCLKKNKTINFLKNEFNISDM